MGFRQLALLESNIGLEGPSTVSGCMRSPEETDWDGVLSRSPQGGRVDMRAHISTYSTILFDGRHIAVNTTCTSEY